MPSQSLCFKCGSTLELGSQVGFKECCPKCDYDIHCCRNCTFYDLNAYNNCKETQADRVVDKENANFCDYFRIRIGSNPSSKTSDSKPKAQSLLDDLFKK